MDIRSKLPKLGAMERMLRMGSVVIVSAAAIYATIEVSRRTAAHRQFEQAELAVRALLEGPPEQWREAIDEVARLRAWTTPLLEACAASGYDDPRRQLAIHLARYQMGDSRDDWIDILLECSPTTLIHAASVLRPARRELIDALWNAAEDGDLPPGRRLRVACLLSALESLDEPRWASLSAFVVDQLIASALVEPDELATLRELLNPARARLLDHLMSASVDMNRPAAERLVAVRFAAELCRDDPLRLVDLLATADTEQLTVLQPCLLPLRGRAEQLLASGLATAPRWNDRGPNAADVEVSESTATAVRAADGWIDERFAYCQTLPFSEFSAISAVLSRSGYRPSRIRPYHTSNGMLAAAIWLRDGQAWRIQDGTADEIRGHDAKFRGEKFQMVDAAGYVADRSDASSPPRYVALWAEAGDSEPSSEVYLGVSRASMPRRSAASRMRVCGPSVCTCCRRRKPTCCIAGCGCRAKVHGFAIGRPRKTNSSGSCPRRGSSSMPGCILLPRRRRPKYVLVANWPPPKPRCSRTPTTSSCDRFAPRRMRNSATTRPRSMT